METYEKTIGELVAADYRTASVFKKYKIDFCCNGNRSIEKACDQNHADPIKVKKELAAVMTSPGTKTTGISDYSFWPLDLLTDYIQKKHHRYVKEQIPVLENYLEKLCKVHGQKHPELLEIRSLFHGCALDLSEHMKKEEQILFPYIRQMAEAKEGHGETFSAPFGTVQIPVRMMMHEHEAEGVRFLKIKDLSNNYAAPEDACSTYKVAYALLNEFEEDLHLHIHLENNILFPKAIELEGTFAC